MNTAVQTAVVCTEEQRLELIAQRREYLKLQRKRAITTIPVDFREPKYARVRKGEREVSYNWGLNLRNGFVTRESCPTCESLNGERNNSDAFDPES